MVEAQDEGSLLEASHHAAFHKLQKAEAMKEIEPNVWLVEPPTPASLTSKKIESDAHLLPGYYFFDETQAYEHGPFGTIEECKQVFAQYCEALG